MRQKSISAFFPAHNESQNLPALIADVEDILAKNFLEYEIIIINDGSTDNSAAVLENLRQSYPHLHVITHPTNLGYGTAVKSGFLAAKNDLIFFSDADRQFDLKELKLLLDKLGRYDAVVGYRRQRSDNLIRIMSARGWNKLIWLVFGINYKDIDCAFKLFTRTILNKIDVGQLISRGAMISAEILIKIKDVNGRVLEVPVSHLSRKFGRATGGNIQVISRAFKELYKLWRVWRGWKI